MGKKVVAFTVLTLSVILIVLYKSGFLKSSLLIRSPLSSNVKTAPTPTTSSIKLKEYLDPSGFTFRYPQALKVKTLETDDQSVYSIVDISSPDHSGKIIIKLEDSDLTDLSEFFEKEDKTKDITLADLDAKQLINKIKIQTSALDEGVLITITVDFEKDKKFWSNINQTIIDSFEFVNPQSNMSSSSSSETDSADDVILEEEEVIE